MLALVLLMSGGGGDDHGDRNRNGNDCNQSENCSDDDQVVIAPVICIEPGSCRFG